MSNQKYDHNFKLLMLGDVRVGKTCLFLRCTDDISNDFKIKIIKLQEKQIKLKVWDIACNERYRITNKTYYKGSHGIILAYDVTHKNSFKNIRSEVNEIK